MQNLKLYEITNGFMSLNNNEELTEEEKVLLEGIDAEIKKITRL